MRSQLMLLGALLRKDARLFWPFAALIAVLVALWQFDDLVTKLGLVGELVGAAIPFATILFILVVFYEDAVVSLKHDWLTRPIPGTTLLLAKCAVVLLVIIAPSILGTLANELYQGRSFAEALRVGTSFGPRRGSIQLVLVAMAFAALTSSIRQAIIVFLVILAIGALLSVSIISALHLPEGEAMGFSGSTWVIGSPMEILLVAVPVLVLWIQYAHRHTRAAHGVVGVAVIASAVFLALMNWPRIFDVQKALSSDPAAESAVRVELATGCFPVAAQITSEMFWEEQRERAGPGAIAFLTQLILKSIPEGHQLAIGPALITYRTSGGEVHRLYPGRMQWKSLDSGLPAANHHWLLSRSDFERLVAAGNVETRIDYAISLLAPTATAEFVADGRRAFYEGIGYCSGTFQRSARIVHVDCFKPGAQPAELLATVEGAPDIWGQASEHPDFTPTAFDFWTGKRHTMLLNTRGDDVPRMKVTAYEARAHFNRSMVVPGVLGGSASACPAP